MDTHDELQLTLFSSNDWSEESRQVRFTELLLFAPCPVAGRRYTKTAFVAAARARVTGGSS